MIDLFSFSSDFTGGATFETKADGVFTIGRSILVNSLMDYPGSYPHLLTITDLVVHAR